MQFKTRTESKESELEVLIETPKPETLTQPKLRRPNVASTRNYAENTSVIDLGTMSSEIRVCIRPFEDEDKFTGLLKGSKERKTYLFKGVTSSHLKGLFLKETRELGRDPFTTIEEDVFQANYRLNQKRDVYAAAKKLNLNYEN